MQYFKQLAKRDTFHEAQEISHIHTYRDKRKIKFRSFLLLFCTDFRVIPLKSTKSRTPNLKN